MGFEYEYDENYENEYDMIADIDDALADFVQGTHWEAMVESLSSETPFEERVRLYQAIRQEGHLPEEITFFLVVWAVEAIANDRTAELLEPQFEPRFAEIETRFGLDPADADDLAHAPAEYQALHLEYAQAAQALFVATFQAFGEHKMARLLRQDPNAFDQHYNAGYEALMGPTTDSALRNIQGTND